MLTPMKQLPHPPSEPVDGATARLAQHCAIGRFMAQHPELVLLVVRHAPGKLAWQALSESADFTLPRAFERGPAQDAEREEHYHELCARAVQSGQLEWRARHGFSDFACCVAGGSGPEPALLLVGL